MDFTGGEVIGRIRKETECFNRTREQSSKTYHQGQCFYNLFKEKKYLVQLYHVLHLESTDMAEEDIREVTVSNVLVYDIYNDVGFMIRSTLLVLVECQSLCKVLHKTCGRTGNISVTGNHYSGIGIEWIHSHCW